MAQAQKSPPNSATADGHRLDLEQPPVLVDLHDVHLRYGPVHALRGVCLRLPPGTIGLIGNNGAGKSTLMKILLGLLRPDQGEGTLLGVDLRHAGSQLRNRIGYMAEADSTVPMLRGVEYVTLSGDLYGMPHRQAKRRAHEVLGYVGLGELRYRRLEEYSTGNLQRLKLAAALVHDPELLLLDEPTSGLDPRGRESFLQLLEDLVADSRKSLILSTHLLADIARLCDQVVVIEQGQIRHSGSRDSFELPPQRRYVLGWEGERTAFVDQLRDAGLWVGNHAIGEMVQVVLPEDWPTGRLFTLAHQTGVQLRHLTPLRPTLEEMFFRLTDQPDPTSSTG